MIHASKILLFINAEYVPALIEDEVRSWELAEYAEDLAGRIARKCRKKVVLGLELIPSKKKRPSRMLVSSKTFHEQYRASIINGLAGCEGIAVLPGLGSASEIPTWLREIAEEQYVPIAPFSAFFSSEESSMIFMETSRKRLELAAARIPMGREGRGGRVK